MPIEIPESESDYMVSFIRRICEEIGPGAPGSPQERERGMVVKEELEKICEDVVVEDFTLAPRAFLGWIRISITALALSILFFFLSPYNPLLFSILAIVTCFIGVIIVWEEFFNYNEFIDPLFKKQTSENVVGTIPSPQNSPDKKILIFSGHHDSAYQFNLLKWFKWGYIVIVLLGMFSIVFYFLLTILQILGVLISGGWPWVTNIVTGLLYVAIPAMIFLWFFQGTAKNGGEVPGAIDNLSAVAVVLGVGRWLKAHPEDHPANLEIKLISFGSEEAGLRGAYRYVERHLEELKQHDAEDFNMDGLLGPKKVQIITQEDTTRTHHSPVVVDKMKQAAENAKVDYITMKGPFVSGGTDATPFSKAKIKAANLCSLEVRKFFSFYHQPADNWTIVNRDALNNALKVAIAYLQLDHSTT